MITRRQLIAGTVAAAVTAPAISRAQKAAAGIRKVGVLVPYTETSVVGTDVISLMRKELGRRGWTDGKNLQLNARRKLADATQIRVEAQALVKWGPDVILCANAALLRAAQQETNTIPIVFVQVADPVGQGFVKTLVKPGGNATGIANYEFSMAEKWLQMLKELVPNLTRAALIYNVDSALANPAFVKAFETAARSLKVTMSTASSKTDADIQGTIAALGGAPGGGFVVLAEPFSIAHRAQIISMAARYKVPGVYPFRYFATGGGLCSYGVNVPEAYQLGMDYVDRILKGEKPADMPIYRPNKFQLVVNLKTAKTLKLTVPSTLIGRADEIIQK